MPVGGIYGTTKSGLQARWGSDLDCRIQRPSVPKTALPSDVRKKLGLKERRKVLMPSNHGDKVDSNIEKGLLNKGVIHIMKKPFLKKGSRCGESKTKKKSALVVHSQIFE